MRIFSGIQPTGELHIGNYFGAIKQWVGLQKDHECIFSIVDLHAMTIPFKPEQMRKSVLDAAITYMALGIDPSKCIIFVQSDVSEHTELAWILNTMTPIGELERMTQFKDKAKIFRKNINAGLLTYPVLQAADILLYQTDLVPIGADQKQHVELTRTIARKFNHLFGETFKEPEALIPKTGGKIMGLNAPTKKMSKSLGQENYIGIFDSPEEIKRKIKKAVTDSGKKIESLEEKPAIANLIDIYSLFAEKNQKDTEKEFEGKGYGEFKESLANLISQKLRPFQERKNELEKNPEKVIQILKEGAKKAKTIAKETMSRVKEKTGISL